MAEKNSDKNTKNSRSKTPDSSQKSKKKTLKKSTSSKENSSVNTKPQENNSSNYLANVMTFLVAGVIVLLSIIVDIVSHINGESALLGIITKPLLGLFGVCTPIIGVYFIVFAYYCYKYRNDKPNKTIKGVLLVLNILFLMGSVHIIQGFIVNIPSTLRDFWNCGKQWEGCGVIGGSIGWFLGKLLHVSVGLIVGVVAYAICLILFLGGSPVKVLRTAGRKIAKFFKFLSTKITESIEKHSNYDEDDEDEEAEEAVEEHPSQAKEKPIRKPKNSENPETTSKPDVPTTKTTETPDSTSEDPTATNHPRTENYVTGSIYDAPIRNEVKNAKAGTESDLDSTPEEKTGEGGKIVNKFGFKMGREARDEDENTSLAESPEAEETSAVDENSSEEDPFDTLSIESVTPEEIPEYIYPSVELLSQGAEESISDPREVEEKKRILLATLEAFKVKANVVNISCGPTITRYEIEPEMGVSVKAIEKLGKDLALRLAAKSLRIEAPIPGKCAVGIEVSNNDRLTVKLRDILDSPVFRDHKSKLFCCLGVDVAGNPVYLDIPKMPHLLIAGATGMGKSVCLNCLIVSLLYRASPKDVRLILIDPKKVEFSHYADIPHLLTPVVTNINKCAATLSWAVAEMENRYDIFEAYGLRNLEEYHKATANDPEAKKLPYIVIVIDELADLMMQVGAEVENYICRLAQKARAAGMHLILGTQRPSVDVITGLIKANIPSRISLAVTSLVDSKTILDTVGAENLLDKGDLLFAPAGARKALRVQGAFVSTEELNTVCEYVREHSVPMYDQDIVNSINDAAKNTGKNKKSKSEDEEAPKSNSKDIELMIAALEVGFEQGTISTSYIQRRLSFGYVKSARVIDMLQQHGYVSAPDPVTKLRKILISPQEFAEMKLNGASSEPQEKAEDEEEE